jgi:hypothetical protein
MSELLQLPLPQIGRGVRPIEELRDLPDDVRPGRIREARQLLQMLRQ